MYLLSLQVVVEKAPNSQIQDIDKRKFLVPSDISVAQFMWIIRKRIQLPSEKAIFLFVGKVLPQSRYLKTVIFIKSLKLPLKSDLSISKEFHLHTYTVKKNRVV